MEETVTGGATNAANSGERCAHVPRCTAIVVPGQSASAMAAASVGVASITFIQRRTTPPGRCFPHNSPTRGLLDRLATWLKRPAGAKKGSQELLVVGGCVVARRSSRRDRARPLASLSVLSALPADCLHNPVPFAPPVTHSRVPPPSGCVLPGTWVHLYPCGHPGGFSFCPHIPSAKIDLGRYSPPWGRTASKISPEHCHNRTKRPLRAGNCDRQSSAPPSFGHFGPGDGVAAAGPSPDRGVRSVVA